MERKQKQPIIPPLPSSKAASLIVSSTVNENDKENHNNLRSGYKMSSSKLPSGKESEASFNKSPSSSESSSSVGLKQPRIRRLPLLSIQSSSKVSSMMAGDKKENAILENLEKFFCLSKDVDEKHKDLCREIMNGSKRNDIQAWYQAIQYATNNAASEAQQSGGSLPETSSKNLFRLHKRAMVHFSFDSVEQKQENYRNDMVLNIWLSYVTVIAKYFSRQKARSILNHIEKNRWGENVAAFFITSADIELDDRGINEDEEELQIKKAINIIQNGIQRNAKPITTLEEYLDKLHKKYERLTSLKLIDSSKDDMNKMDKKKTYISSIPSLPSLKSGLSQNHMPRNNILQNNNNMPQNSLKLSVGQKDTLIDPDFVSSTNKKEDSIRNISTEENIEKLSTKTQPPKRKLDDTPLGALSTTVVKEENKLFVSRLNRKRPAISRKRLGGRAIRVAANNMITSVDSSDDEEIIDRNNEGPSSSESHLNKRTRIDETDERSVSKITRADINYMLNWDPTAKRDPTKTKLSHASGNSNSTQSSWSIKTNDDKNRSKHDESMSNNSASDKSVSCKNNVIKTKTEVPKINTLPQNNNMNTKSANETNDKSNSNNIDVLDTDPNMDGTESKEAGSVSVQTSNEVEQEEESSKNDKQSTPSSSEKILSNINANFLPLVQEENILTVNKTPYAKLCVIGKGGSCKVYRALSKSHSVVAIKRVKLGGMDKKAILGYANEIKLLKRLRGNPFIIQLHDSEVDLARKAIFLVMEVGEVDLNQVLQQQVLKDDDNFDNKGTVLNMNFIRLTWQQMLSAVHSIHQERIIHGDLKPANFLFVRGVLKLIDFGIAKAIQSDDTTNIYRESQIGTLNYMSPESILDTGTGTNGARMKCGRVSESRNQSLPICKSRNSF